MPTSPLVADIETLALEIHTNGKAIDDTYVVLAVDVDHEVNRIPTARVVISEGDVGEVPGRGHDRTVSPPPTPPSPTCNGATSSARSAPPRRSRCFRTHPG